MTDRPLPQRGGTFVRDDDGHPVPRSTAPTPTPPKKPVKKEG